jgi:hypothetical protein
VATRVAAAADSVEKMAIQGGLSAEAVERIRDQVMGIAK